MDLLSLKAFLLSTVLAISPYGFPNDVKAKQLLEELTLQPVSDQVLSTRLCEPLGISCPDTSEGVAGYNYEQNFIIFSEKCEQRMSVMCTSALIHEFVHFLQAANSLVPNDRIMTPEESLGFELVAYDVQADWLEQQGVAVNRADLYQNVRMIYGSRSIEDVKDERAN